MSCGKCEGLAILTPTKYGNRYDCPECKCYKWDGSTSTFANKETHESRKTAKAFFKILIHNHGKPRAYKMLKEYMKLDGKDAHIGMFNIEQCKKVVDWINK